MMTMMPMLSIVAGEILTTYLLVSGSCVFQYPIPCTFRQDRSNNSEHSSVRFRHNPHTIECWCLSIIRMILNGFGDSTNEVKWSHSPSPSTTLVNA